MNKTLRNDGDFGPVVRDYRGDFDFTLVFEDTVLSIVPSILVLVLAAGRILYLHKKPKLVWARKFQLSKVVGDHFLKN
jgi:ATP-binding cassette subfamily C (CFTR/MRP) protein 1